ncbi:MAG: transcriptional coactivator p15/PC4 family protein [Paracoccaceae bacterium]
MTNRVLARISRPRGKEVRLTLGEYKGQISLRLQAYHFGKGGQMRPSKQGFTIPLDSVDDLIDGLTKARRLIHGQPAPDASSAPVQRKQSV